MSAPPITSTGYSGLGSGSGFLYIVDTDGTSIMNAVTNTVGNAKNILRDALIAAPNSGEVLATGAVTVNVGGGTITTCTVNGVDVMGATAATGATPALLATSLAAKINSTVSVPDYTAVVIGTSANVVQIKSLPGTGSTPNGYVVSAGVTAPTTVTTVNMNGGKDGTGVYDPVFGARYFINTDSSATSSSLVGAVEITSNISMRGLQGAIAGQTKVISSGIIAPDRFANISSLEVDTEAAAASDNLDTITVSTNFQENDILRIRGVNSGRIVTLLSGTGNIFLLGGTSFSTGTLQTAILLQYQAPVMGTAGWYEIARGTTLPTVAILRGQGIPQPVSGTNLTSLTAGGGTINIEAGVDKGTQVYDGSAVLAGSWVIQPQAAPSTPYLDGDEIWVDYRSTLTVGGNTVTIFGITLTTTQALEGRVLVRAKYKLSNTTWYSSLFYRAHGVDITNRAYVDATFEDALGNPAADGYVLSSTTGGTRSWIPVANSALNEYDSVALDTNTTLTAGTSQPILKVTSTSTTTTSANRVITLVPSATAGVNNNFKIIIGYGKVGAGFTWKIKYSATDLVSLIEGTFQPTVYDCYWDGTTYIVTASADLYFSNADSDVRAQERLYTAEWSFAQNGGAVSTITLPTQFPAGTIVKANEAIIECVEALTSGGAATVAWGYTGVTTAFSVAVGFGASPYTAANLVAYGTTPAASIIKLTGNESVTITIAGAALTAGYARIFIPVIIDKL